MADTVLAKFATSTGHRDYELDSAQAIARKLLATQFARWRSVYPYVGNDLGRLEFRAQAGFAPADWNRHISLPLQAWQQLVPASESEMQLSKTLMYGKGAYYDFRAHLLASPVPLALEKDTPLLFFMAASGSAKNLRALVDDYYQPQGLDTRKTEAIYQHLLAYQPHQHLTERQLDADIGFMLANMPLPQLGDVYLVPAEARAAPAPEAEPEPVPAPVREMVLAPEKVHRVSQKHLEKLASNSVFLQYAKTAQLAAHFPLEKTAKQMLVAILVPDKNLQFDFANAAMGRRQTRLGTVSTSAMNADEWQQIMAVATFTGDTDNAQVRSFYDTLASAMPREDVESLSRTELLQHMMTVHVPDYQKLWPVNRDMERAIGRYLAKYPTMDMKLVQL